MSWTLDPSANLRVLLPFDFSEAATQALVTAMKFAGTSERLFVLHVVPPIEAVSPSFLAGELDPKQLLERAESSLTQVLAKAGIEGAQLRVHMGDPASEILSVAREVEAAMIVIPSQGKSGLRRWMIGSVAERVVRRAACPVLVLPITSTDDGDEA